PATDRSRHRSTGAPRSLPQRRCAMRPVLSLLAIAALGGAFAAAADDSAPAASELPSTRVEQFDGGTRWEVTVPGVLVSYVVARSEAGRKDVWLLVAKGTHVTSSTQ